MSHMMELSRSALLLSIAALLVSLTPCFAQFPNGDASQFFSCDKGAVSVAPAGVCNGAVDCKDRSDESEATCSSKFKCEPSGRVACPTFNGNRKTRCVFSTELCNGVPNCPKATDEASNFCSKINCTATNRDSCPGTGCLLYGQKCDGIKQCLDGSDEHPGFCDYYNCSSGGANLVKCPGGGQCVSSSLLCDGNNDCHDGSDEAASLCNTYDCSLANKTACPAVPGYPRKCTYAFNICDGEPDCPGGGDEAPVHNCSTWSCAYGYVSCPGSNICKPGFYCDGLSDCPFNETDPAAVAPDEDPAFCAAYECGPGLSKCADGLQCIFANTRCDGRADCVDRSDEDPTFCSTFNCTADGRIFCPSGSYCLLTSCSICGDMPMCPDQSDTDPSNCHLRDPSCP